MKHTQRAALAAAPLLAVALAACGGEDTSAIKTNDTAATAKATKASIPSGAVVLDCPTSGQVIVTVDGDSATVTAPSHSEDTDGDGTTEPLTDLKLTDRDPADDFKSYTDDYEVFTLSVDADGQWYFSKMENWEDTCKQTGGPESDTKERAKPSQLVEFNATSCDTFKTVPVATLGITVPMFSDTTETGDIACLWNGAPSNVPGAFTPTLRIRVAEAQKFYLAKDGAVELEPLTELVDAGEWSWVITDKSREGASDTIQFKFIAESSNGTSLICETEHSKANWGVSGTKERALCDDALARVKQP